MERIKSILSQFKPVPLKELDQVKLQKRVDTKYIAPYDVLYRVLEKIAPEYCILNVKGNLISSYRTQYYDTPELGMYIKHQNGKQNRLKVRKRQYVESNISFLEAKFKSNKSVTIKNRVKQPEFDLNFTQEDIITLSDLGHTGLDLKSTLFNSFSRITLANPGIVERATIDLNLCFEFNGKNLKLANTCIIEVKQEKFNAASPLVRALKNNHCRSVGFSKYCIGMSLCDSSLKQNNFKQRILELKKFEHGLST